MNCRYCGGVYAATERSCGGCGAPKTAVQTLLDVPVAPDHWSHSMFSTVQRVAIVSVAISVAAGLFSLVGIKTLGMVIAFFWMVFLAPAGLALGAWQASIGNFPERIRNFVVAGLMWFGISLAMLLVIGLTAVS